MTIDATLIARLGGRKFLVCILAMIGVHATLAFGLITAIIYRDLMVAIAAAYITGNVWQKVKAPAPADTAKAS